MAALLDRPADSSLRLFHPHGATLQHQNLQYRHHRHVPLVLCSNFDPVLRWNYLATYLIVPLFAILLLYASSIGREIVLEHHNRPVSLQ